jgi:hypothetical protein
MIFYERNNAFSPFFVHKMQIRYARISDEKEGMTVGIHQSRANKVDGTYENKCGKEIIPVSMDRFFALATFKSSDRLA